MPARSRMALYIRNVVFGIEDSLVSTVGLLAGLAAVGTTSETILLTGAVLVFVEAFSMAGGSFLSEESAQEYESNKRTKLRHRLFAAFLMFVSYVIAGFFPIVPYVFLEGMMALYVSVGLSLAILALVGVVHGTVAEVPKFRSALRMLLIGGAAIILGIVVGQLFGIA